MNESTTKKQGKWKIVLLVFIAILLVLLVALFLAFKHYYGKSNYIADANVTTMAAAELPEDAVDDLAAHMNESEQAEEQEKALAAQAKVELPNKEDVYNILLIGVDRRDTTWHGNSDSMMLLSINKETETMHLISFMRDTYAIIDGSAHKLNYAHAIGGGPKLVEAFRDNFRIEIDNYASVDFVQATKVIDLLGGVDIEVTSAEASYINKTASDSPSLSGEGLMHLDGAQAVAYSRIRKIGTGGDAHRTERQRIVMSALFEKAKTMNVADLAALADEILPLLTHNITEGEVLSLVTGLPAFLSYDLKLDRVPYDGLFYMKGEMKVPEWEETIERLLEEIYGE